MSLVDIFGRNGTDATAHRLPADELLHLLSNQRRRRTIRLVAEGGLTKSDLAEHLTDLETEGRTDSQDRKRVYVGMHQCHLPKLEESGVVELDRDMVSPGPAHSTALDALDAIQPFVEGDADA